MNINIDYDGTYTTNPEMWDKIIAIMKAYDCNVYCITKRYAKITKQKPPVQIIHAMRSKLEASKVAGLDINIWIDDKPQSITPYKLIKNARYK